MCGGYSEPYIPKSDIWKDVLGKLNKANSHIFIELVRGCNSPCPFKCYGSLRNEKINITPQEHNDIIVPLFRQEPYYYPSLKIIYYGYGDTTNYPFWELNNFHTCQVNLRGDISIKSPIFGYLASPIRGDKINMLGNLYSVNMAKNVNSIQSNFFDIFERYTKNGYLSHITHFFDAVQIPVLKDFNYIEIAKHVIGLPIIFRGIAKDSASYVEIDDFLKEIKQTFGEVSVKVEEIKNVKNNNIVLEGITTGSLRGYIPQDNISLIFRRCIRNDSKRFELTFDNIEDLKDFTNGSDKRCADFSKFINNTPTKCKECFPSWKVIIEK